MNKLDELIVDSIHPFLKSVGFRKKGRSWNRSRGNFIDVIQIQESKHRTEESIEFTVNLGVFVPELWEIVWQKPHRAFANEADCWIRNRLGDLLQGKPFGDAYDTWWSISRGESPSETDDGVLNEVLIGLKEHAVGFLESFDDYGKIVSNLLAQRGALCGYGLSKINLALAQWKAGHEADAVQTLNSVKDHAWGEKADSIRRFIHK